MGGDGDMGGIKGAKRDMTTLTLFIEEGIRAKYNHNTNSFMEGGGGTREHDLSCSQHSKVEHNLIIIDVPRSSKSYVLITLCNVSCIDSRVDIS